MYQDQEAAGAGDRSSEGQRIAPRLRESSQRCDKLLTTLLAVKLRDQEWGKHEVKDTRGALSHFGIHMCLFTVPRDFTFISFSLSLWNDHGNPVDLYLMVWDWRVLRAGSMFFIDLRCSLPFCLLLFSLSLFHFHRLILKGWGLWTENVWTAFSQPYIADLF